MNLSALSKTLSNQPGILALGPNLTGKDYFCGDLHGQYQSLMRALKKADFNSKTDRLFTVGNMIDYGFHSSEILDLLDTPWFYSVIGLHELLMRYAIESGHYLHWQTQGAEWAFEHNMQLKAGIADKLKAINRLPLALSIEHRKHGHFGVLNASNGVIQDWSDIDKLNGTQMLQCLTDRELGLRKMNAISGIDCLVVGAHSAKKAWSRANVVGINLGARHLPAKGQLKLFKSKKLLKAIEQHHSFQKL